MTGKQKSNTMQQRAITNMLGPDSHYCKIWSTNPTMSGIIYEHAERLQPDAGNDVRAQTCEAISRDPAQLQEAVDACPDAKRQIVGERYLLNLGKGGVAR